MEKQDYKLAIKLALIDLIHNMNRDTTLKLNVVIICVQLVMLIVSLILQVTMLKYKLVGASLMNSFWSTAMLFVILINVKIISAKAMKKAKEQKDVIEALLDGLTEDGSETNESHK